MSFLDLPLVSILFRNNRSISSITGYITISENTRDDLEITQQPVQQGSTISDHAFKKPTVLTMQIQFNGTSLASTLGATAGGIVGGALGPLGGLAGGAIGGAIAGAIFGGGDPLAQAYQQLLTLQSSLTPFDIATPKRIYKSMLFQSIGVTTDKRTEKVLSVSAGFQQVVIVNVTTAIVPLSLQKNPGATAATQAVGSKSAALTTFQGVSPGTTGFQK